MVQIRQLSDKDKNQVLALLHHSFPKNNADLKWWDWKYCRNPAGDPLLLIAEKNSAIVGLRAFWPRLFISGNEICKLYQAADTAVHPQERGQGIFKKLTTEAISRLQRQKPPTAIFNFPNDQSGPGYLKMGWEATGLLRWRCGFLPNRRKDHAQPVSPEQCLNSLPDIPKAAGSTFLKDRAYVKWRYLDHPRNQYQFWLLNPNDDSPVYAVTSTVTRKKVRTRLLVDLLGGQNNIGVDGGISPDILSEISSRIPAGPRLPLTILESGMKSCGKWQLRRQGFFRLPALKVNFFTRAINDESLSKRLAQAAIFPGDIDTF